MFIYIFPEKSLYFKRMYMTPILLLTLNIPGSEASSIYNYLSLNHIKINVTDIPRVVGHFLIQLLSN